MQTGPAGFATALANRSIQTLTGTVNAVVGGSGNELVDGGSLGTKVVVRRELSGELPATASLIEGSLQSSLTVEADGRILGAPSPFSSADAEAWLGAPITAGGGYGGLTVPTFDGTIREFASNETDRIITFTARDAADKLAAAVSLPAYGSVAPDATPGAPARHPLNTQGVITGILHQNGIRMTPAPRSATCVVSVPGIGGWMPDIGWVVHGGAGQAAGSTWLEAGRFGMIPKLAPNNDLVTAYLSKRYNWTASVYVMLECWV
ncbi:hypothetical protein, partial [Chryseobacterium hispalense]|uniref:hypothetical protein n=1 Tax=Chryseobacterium hispalense TaxID=1453492 RepID=UPI001E520757